MYSLFSLVDLRSLSLADCRLLGGPATVATMSHSCLVTTVENSKERSEVRQALPSGSSILYLTARVVGGTSLSPSLSPPIFRETVKDVIENKRELNQAVTYLHEIGV